MPVLTWRTVTCAPGTTRPEGSLITPEILPPTLPQTNAADKKATAQKPLAIAAFRRLTLVHILFPALSRLLDCDGNIYAGLVVRGTTACSAGHDHGVASLRCARIGLPRAAAS